MRTGKLISAAGHAAIIAAAVFGLPWISPSDREAIRVTEVSFISEAEFEAAASGGTRTPDPTAPAVVLPPETAEAPELPAVSELAPENVPEPLQEPEEPEQDVATLAPQFETGSTLRSPSSAVPDFAPSLATPEQPRAVTAPRARPSTRIEPVPTPPPPEPVRPAEVPVEEAVPEPEAEEPREVEVAAAPREAAPEPVAEPSPPAPLALQRSAPPPRRPERLAAVAPAPSVAPEPAAPPAETRSPADLVRELAAATPATQPTAPSVTEPTAPAGSSLPVGPPMTGSEKDGLKFAIQRCWNVPAGLRNAEELRIVVAAEIAADGALIANSVRLIEPASIPDGRYDAAYRAARSALIRCSPYTDLPRAKFAQWRNIEVVFNPEGMVSW